MGLVEYKEKIPNIFNSRNKNIRIEKIELQNFKGVKNGVIEFNCQKNPFEKDINADLLGMYGPNGSGKTTLLEALHITKLVMMGESIPVDIFGNIISQDSGFARMIITFQVINDDETIYHLEYAYSISKKIVTEYIRSDSEELDDYSHLATLLSAGILGGVGLATLPASIIAGVTASSAATIANQTVSRMLGSAIGSTLGKEMKINSDHHNEFIETTHFVVFDEVLSLSGMFDGTTVRFAPIFDTRTKETAFLPKSKHKLFFPQKTAASIKELQRYKEYNIFNSLIFGDSFCRMLIEQGNISEYGQIIFDLRSYAFQNLRIMDSRISGITNENVIQLFTSSREFIISGKDSTIYLDEFELPTLEIAIEGINVILKQLIPGLSLQAVKQIDQDISDATIQRQSRLGSKVMIYSVRDNIRVPLVEESKGIIRLISSLGLYALAFNNAGMTVAIDEIDAGVYEYLLGELLLIFEEYGYGQLIFTCHNLRPLEVLDKKFIYFTTTNKDNRFLKPKNIRYENNLRDVYLREILIGGQEEELYSTAKHGKIAAALQKAGDILGKG